jgi:hypothetical protein
MDRKGLQTPSGALDRHTSSTLLLNPDFDLTSFSTTALEGLPPFEETDHDDEDDTFFKTRSAKGRSLPRKGSAGGGSAGASGAGIGTGSDGGSGGSRQRSKTFDDVDMNDMTIER